MFSLFRKTNPMQEEGGHMAACGAKTRSGNPCKTSAMKNGRCRMHGGKSTGAPPEKIRGNKNAVTTGEYETILGSMDDQELELFFKVNTEAFHQIDQEIRLLEIRERRMLQRIKKLADGPEMVGVSTDTSELKNKQVGKSVGRGERFELAVELIQRIEESLTRVQERKAKFIGLRNAIENSQWRREIEEKKSLW